MAHGLWGQEPFATMRAHPRRFAWGVPLAFLVPIGLGLLLADWNLSVAIALQLFLQTGALLWLYIPPARARWKAEREARAGRLDRNSPPVSRGVHGGDDTLDGEEGQAGRG